jgi:hypothetical protein
MSKENCHLKDISNLCVRYVARHSCSAVHWGHLTEKRKKPIITKFLFLKLCQHINFSLTARKTDKKGTRKNKCSYTKKTIVTSIQVFRNESQKRIFSKRRRRLVGKTFFSLLPDGAEHGAQFSWIAAPRALTREIFGLSCKKQPNYYRLF